MYIQAHTKIFTKDIIKNAFKVTGIYPFNPGYVLDTLITTPLPLSTRNGMPTSLPWNSSTPLTLRQLKKQVKVVDSAIKEDQDYIEPLTAHLTTKGALTSSIYFKRVSNSIQTYTKNN